MSCSEKNGKALLSFVTEWLLNHKIVGQFELEGRIGLKIDREFKPGVDERVFESVRNTLARMTLENKFFDSYDIIHGKGRISLNPENLQCKECINKKCKKSVDFKCSSSAFDLRFSVADEVPMDPNIVFQSSYLCERLKKRHSFFFGNVRVDLTRTQGRTDKLFTKPFSKPVFEIEIEFMNNTLLLSELLGPNNVSKTLFSFLSFVETIQNICSAASRVELVENSTFDVCNGFSGLKRDIILRLCRLMWADEQKIRTVFGICAKSFEWKRHRFFTTGRPLGITISLRPNPKGGCALFNTPLGPGCSFTAKEGVRTVFVNQTMTEGVFRWTVRHTWDSFERGVFSGVGAAPIDLLNLFNDDLLGSERVPGTVLLQLMQDDDDIEYRLLGVSGDVINYKDYNPELISIEVDCAAGTLAFFLDEEKFESVVSGVRVPLCFGVSGCTPDTELSFTSVSFRRLPSSTPSTVRCVEYKMIA